jgi:hypothetical protein
MVAAVIALVLSGTPSADLRITVWPQGRTGAARVSTLHCPSAATACRRLGAIPGNPFAPTPPGTACTQIYGGPQEALVTGRFRGRTVWTRFSRRDGCATERWNRVAFLFAK